MNLTHANPELAAAYISEVFNAICVKCIGDLPGSIGYRVNNRYTHRKLNASASRSLNISPNYWETKCDIMWRWDISATRYITLRTYRQSGMSFVWLHDKGAPL